MPHFSVKSKSIIPINGSNSIRSRGKPTQSTKYDKEEPEPDNISGGALNQMQQKLSNLSISQPVQLSPPAPYFPSAPVRNLPGSRKSNIKFVL